MATSHANPLGRRCFRCGSQLTGPAPTDATGREICATCAARRNPTTTTPPTTSPTTPPTTPDDRVQLDLGPSARATPLRTATPAAHHAAPSTVSPPASRVTPIPAKPIPPVKAPELPDMSGFAPSNQYVPKAPAPTIDDAEPIPERVCSECGYSLEGLETTLCPECGHENKPVRKPKSQILEEESRRIARLEYVKPAVTLAAGILIVVAILLLGRPWLTAVGWVGGLPVRVIIGTLAYFLCCLWFFGFDAPWRLTALRLAATYAISDIPIAIIRSIGFNAAMPLAYVIAMAICVAMFIWLFELDPSDAWLLVMVSTVVNGVVGFLLAVAISMVV